MNIHSMQVQNTTTKREQQAEERRNQLIDTALSLFSEKGWENTTIKDLADAAGVAPGLFYHYFESKEDLLLSVFEKHGFNAELRRVIQPAAERPASEVLLEVANSYYKLLTERESFVRMFVREAMTNPKLSARWTSTCNEGVQLLASYLQERVEAGELRPHNTMMSARMLVHPIAMLHLTGGNAAELQDLVENLLQGIRAQGPGSR